MKNSFHYFTSASIPNSKAHCIQILKMCDALSEFYDLNLYCSFSRLKNTIKKDFHLNNNFKIINFYFFKFRALAFFQKLFFFFKINQKQNLFTREIVYAFWGIFFYEKIYLELHNNYPSLKNISYYLLPILYKNKKVKFIFISNELYKIYSKKIYIKDSNYVIAHDASENFNTRKSHLRIPNGNLNIGYAGSFYKVEELILFLI